MSIITYHVEGIMPVDELYGTYVTATSESVDWSTNEFDGETDEFAWTSMECDTIDVPVDEFNETDPTCAECGDPVAFIKGLDGNYALFHVGEPDEDGDYPIEVETDQDHEADLYLDPDDFDGVHIRFASADAADLTFHVVGTGQLEVLGQTVYLEGPMMNYRYEVDLNRIGSMEDAAFALKDVPLCIVDMEGDHYLALTGGGMDLSWEICEAYMRLGYLPPTHFARLPRYAGTHGEKHLLIVEAMKKSHELQIGWLQSNVDDLNRLETELREGTL